MQKVLIMGEPASGKKTWIEKLQEMPASQYYTFTTDPTKHDVFDKLIYTIDSTKWCALFFDFQRVREMGTAIPSLDIILTKIDLLSLSARDQVYQEVAAIIADVAPIYHISCITGENITAPFPPINTEPEQPPS
jgi:hypothetical protein